MFRSYLVSLPLAVLVFSIAFYNLRQTLCTDCSGGIAKIFRCSESKMTALKVGDSFPEGVEFLYVPYTDEKAEITACGMPQPYNASKEFADKKVVLFAVPGAFTPSCSVRHLPGYIEHWNELKGKGVDLVIVIAMNDPFVMSAWGKANDIKKDEILFMTDPGIAFSKRIGWTKGPERTGRYAIVVDHGKIVYAENEPAGDVTVSGAEAVLSKL